MRRPEPIDRPLPRSGRPRTVEIPTIEIPSIPLVDARERFLTDLRWKTSKLSNRRITARENVKQRIKGRAVGLNPKAGRY